MVSRSDRCSFWVAHPWTTRQYYCRYFVSLRERIIILFGVLLHLWHNTLKNQKNIILNLSKDTSRIVGYPIGMSRNEQPSNLKPWHLSSRVFQNSFSCIYLCVRIEKGIFDMNQEGDQTHCILCWYLVENDPYVKFYLAIFPRRTAITGDVNILA